VSVTSPLVSVITPSFNQARFVGAALESVLSQDYPNIEYAVCDGGSTDGTTDIIRGYAGRLSYWISEPDAGQSDAMNKGLANTSGEIVTFLNSDDLLLPGAITAAVECLQRNPAIAAVYGDVDFIDESDRLVRRLRWRDFDFVSLLTHRLSVPSPGAFFRRAVLDEVGWLDPTLHFAMDYDLWLRVGARKEVAHLHRALAHFRLSDSSKSVRQANQWLDELVRIAEHRYGDEQFAREFGRFRASAFAGAYLQGAANALTVADTRMAFKALIRSARAHPPMAGRLDWWLVGMKAVLSGSRSSRVSRATRRILRSFGFGGG
jgi:glycosyltransferase involved in cell wall biosynthesis